MLPWKRKPSLPQAASISPTFTAPLTHVNLCATEAGLILWRATPHSTDTHHLPRHSKRPPYQGPATLVHWGKDGQVEELDGWDESSAGEDGVKVLVDGVCGLLRAFEDCYLIVCTQSRVVANLGDRSSSIHQVLEAVSIPLAPFRARTLLSKLSAKQSLKARQTHAVSSSSASSSSTAEESDSSEQDPQTQPATPQLELLSDEDDEADNEPLPVPAPAKKSPVRPFWQRRFAPKSFKKTAAEPKLDGSDAEGERPASPVKSSFATTADLASSTTEGEKGKGKEKEIVAAVEEASTDKEYHAARRELDRKLVHEAEKELKGMYWSAAVDITRSMQHKFESQTVSPPPSSASSTTTSTPTAPIGALSEPLSRLPMWRRVDRRFWWNEYIANVEGLRSLTLCLMQGSVRQVSIGLPLQPYSVLDPAEVPLSPGVVPIELTLISRRSIERPGLRYQRRGVDANGSVANMVETEFVISAERDGVKHVCSFVQTRGSIPVYWKQSPWALKPPPTLDGTPEESQVALARHFKKQVEIYGRQVIMNLAETSGKEGVVVGAYREGVKRLERPDVEYNEWDFHHECSGMRFENVQKLVALMEDELEDISCFWATNNGQVFSTQEGVVRTNCIDCLDRTNVVQSALGRHILNRHLVHLGITTHIDGEHSQLTTSFNEIWADNGDAISRQYAGTSALKGDYTRTGVRNWRGAVNDASNSVQRLLQSTTSDFFRQAMIEYVLGQNLAVFDNFQERLEAADPGELLKLARIRQVAIDTSFASTLVEGESRVQGWTFLSPVEPNVIKSPKGAYEEKILLLSNKAIYSVSYSFSLQKVTEFVRVPLGDVVKLKQGAYFISAQGAHDPNENWGLALTYRTGQADQRQRTYSLKVKVTQKRPSVLNRSASVRSTKSTASIATVSQAAAEEQTTPTPAPEAEPEPEPEEPAEEEEESAAEAVFAYKALRRDALRLASDGTGSRLIDRRREESSGGAKTTRAFVAEVVEALRAECEKAGAVGEGEEGRKGWEEEGDLISFAEARKNLGWSEALSHSIKSLVWG